MRKKTLGYIILEFESFGALPLGDWIRGIGSSSKSNMPIKGNGPEDKLKDY